METKQKTLYVTDLDGTLMRNDETISAWTEQTVNELVELVGISGATICRYEKGERKMSVDIAKKIAEVLGVKWWRLYD